MFTMAQYSSYSMFYEDLGVIHHDIDVLAAEGNINKRWRGWT